MSKTFIYKVYDRSDNYISTLGDVINEPMLPSQINTGGNDLTLHLARTPTDYNEDDEIAFGNIIKMYVKDDEYTTPTLFWQGTIVGYTPKYDTNKEGVELSLYSRGYELNSMIYKADETIEQSQSSGSSEQGLGTGDKLAQSFIPDQPTLTTVVIKMRVVAPVDITLSIHTDNGGEPSASAVNDSTLVKSVTDTTQTTQTFVFSTPPTLTVGNTYWLQVAI